MRQVVEDRVKTLRFSSYYPKAVKLDKYDQKKALFQSTPTRDHHAHVLVSRTEVLHLCCMEWRAASETQIITSGTFYGEDTASKKCRYEEKMSYKGTGDV